MSGGRGNKKQSRINSNKQWRFGVYTRRSFDDLDTSESNTIINQKELSVDYLKDFPNGYICI